jgi:hypothetical protein
MCPAPKVTATAKAPSRSWPRPDRGTGRPVISPTTMPPAIRAAAVMTGVAASLGKPGDKAAAGPLRRGISGHRGGHPDRGLFISAVLTEIARQLLTAASRNRSGIRRSSKTSECASSFWFVTETYSPVPIENALATSAAPPVSTTGQHHRVRSLAADLRLPWERPAPPGRLTPARVRRGFRNIRTTLPSPADALKPGPAGHPDQPTADPHPATTWAKPSNENAASKPSTNAQVKTTR